MDADEDRPGATGASLPHPASPSSGTLASLGAASQADVAVPRSGALDGSGVEGELTSERAAVDTRADVIGEATIFDRHSDVLEDGEVEAPDFVRTSEPTPRRMPGSAPDDDEDARRQAMAETRDRLEHGRGRANTRAARRAEAARRSETARARADETGTTRSASGARHAAHAAQTSKRAARVVADVTDLEDLDQAMNALEVVVAGIVQRIQPSEAGDLLAQLPSELREKLLQRMPAGPQRDLTRESIERNLCSRLDIELEQAERFVERVGLALEQLVSPGEIAHVRAQLPKEMQSLLPDQVAHRTP